MIDLLLDLFKYFSDAFLWIASFVASQFSIVELSDDSILYGQYRKEDD